MTFWPTTLLRYVWPTPMRPLMMGTTIIRPTNRLRFVEVLAGDGLVDEQLEQERVDEAQEARDEDRDQDDQRPGSR